MRDHRPDDQGIDRDARRAGHQRRDQDGGQPVAFRVDHPRRHDARNGASKAGEQRDKGATVQPRPAHDLVHQERRAGHIAAIFQHDDEQKQDQDLRQKDQHAANPGDHPIHDQVAYPAWWQDLRDQSSQTFKA